MQGWGKWHFVLIAACALALWGSALLLIRRAEAQQGHLRLEWRYRHPAELRGSVWRDPRGGLIFDDTEDGLNALAGNGELRWKSSLPDQFFLPEHFQSLPGENAGVLLSDDQARSLALDSSGRRLWFEYPEYWKARDYAPKPGAEQASLFAVAGRIVYGYSGTGELLWAVLRPEHNLLRYRQDVAIREDGVYCITEDWQLWHITADGRQVKLFPARAESDAVPDKPPSALYITDSGFAYILGRGEIAGCNLKDGSSWIYQSDSSAQGRYYDFACWLAGERLYVQDLSAQDRLGALDTEGEQVFEAQLGLVVDVIDYGKFTLIISYPPDNPQSQQQAWDAESGALELRAFSRDGLLLWQDELQEIDDSFLMQFIPVGEGFYFIDGQHISRYSLRESSS